MQKIASKLHLPKLMPDTGSNSMDKEPIKAYLRIRPAPEDSSKEHSEPYIDVISDCDVIMNPPSESGPTRARTHSKLPPTKYTFAKVFGPEVRPQSSQAAFFQETTLPMVNELLQGESGLIFTYGVTNSGKSYTIQGGDDAGDAGILPRALDVVFNSIDGLASTTDIWPVGLYGVARAPPHAAAASSARASSVVDPWSVPSLSKRFAAEASKASFSPSTYEHDPTKLKVDRNYRYSIWISYVEVYNEKLFDLLDVGAGGNDAKSTPSSTSGMTRSDSIRGSNWSIAGLASSGTLSDLASVANGGGPISLSRKPLTLKTDPEGSGKYVAGLKEVRVKNIQEARDLMKKGQDNRVVFGTMANRASSRSHGVFTIKVVREHAGAGPDESLACTVSRLSIVDLAGSERISNTSTSGERRKEAGSINKSLMCLGQCLDTLRKNQARAAAMIPSSSPLASAAGSLDDPLSAVASKAKRRPSVVPFRHSKLTELFQPFFTGEGRTVMIVNANPYDTGFDENSHVMKFSAVAKEVQIVRNAEPGRERAVHRVQSKALPFPSTDAQPDYSTPPGTPRGKYRSAPSPVGGATPRVPVRSLQPPPSRRETGVSQQEITIIEESDEEGEDDDDEANESDPFVDLLMDKHEELRQRLYEAEARAAAIEASVREEMARAMAARFAEMERKYTERLLSEAESNEEFFNQKIDLLVRANTQEQQRAKDRFDALATPRAGGKSHRSFIPTTTPRAGGQATRSRDSAAEESEVEQSLQTALDTTSDASTSGFALQPGPSQGKTSRRSMMLAVEDDDEDDEGEESRLTVDETMDESAEDAEDVDDSMEVDGSEAEDDGDGDDDDEEEEDSDHDEEDDDDGDDEDESVDESIEDYEPSADEESEEDDEVSSRRAAASRRRSTAQRSTAVAPAGKRRNTASSASSSTPPSVSANKASRSRDSKGGALAPSSSFNQQQQHDEDDSEDQDSFVLKKKPAADTSPKKRFFNKKSIGRVVDEEEMERRVERY